MAIRLNIGNPPFPSRSRNVCFTLNNPKISLEEFANNLSVANGSSVRYAVFQLESGNALNTLHIQGYLEFACAVSLKHIKDLIGDGAHVETRKGTRQQARNYCMKEDTRVEGPVEIGDWLGGGQGKRNDLMEVKEMIDGGKSELEVAEAHFGSFIRHSRGFREYKRLKQGQRHWKTEVIIMFGPPGTGKSSSALKFDPDAYWKQKGPWWDGYDGHKTVVIDEYYGWLPYDTLNRLCDEYPLLVETKGGQANFVAKTIIFTTNTSPDKWYNPDKIPTFISFARRITEVQHFVIRGVEPDIYDWESFYEIVVVPSQLRVNPVLETGSPYSGFNEF